MYDACVWPYEVRAWCTIPLPIPNIVVVVPLGNYQNFITYTDTHKQAHAYRLMAHGSDTNTCIGHKRRSSMEYEIPHPHGDYISVAVHGNILLLIYSTYANVTIAPFWGASCPGRHSATAAAAAAAAEIQRVRYEFEPILQAKPFRKQFMSFREVSDGQAIDEYAVPLLFSLRVRQHFTGTRLLHYICALCVYIIWQQTS